ncbi:Subtilisin-like protease SBT4.15 [Actinidia chinensis var. chinensis]|uniref:Subtilisin-like protease SBT4.15 n=1 Tax=Actinidia chinensis var. chinensis TaxID=1590841 RepID=A0A2R6Q6G5_ACTCC|nr:Subtilisin-like protease SBT4.15 [Actinidia chinensis var. chinensis]
MKLSETLLVLVFFHLCLGVRLISTSTHNERKPYIVYMGDVADANDGLAAHADQHNTLLVEAIGDEGIAKESMIHSYGRSFNGFVARLLPHEASRLAQKESVVSVFPNTIQKLHTTRSWEFLGMPETVRRNLKAESNLIIGVFDTGIWPQSPSFNDKGYGPPPPKWKGKCAKGANFTGCNNKVIGATYFNLNDPDMTEEDLTPVDTDGHGTHISSIAAGVPVPGASLYGLAAGTARGGAPSARISMYKVCWYFGCSDMDLLAGLDAAIADGVDVISVSIGPAGVAGRDFFEDALAIGAFHAVKKGIFVSCAGGNFGPELMTVQNVAPWMVTVAASSIDRQFQTAVKWGSGLGISGISINTFSPRKKSYPLTSGSHAANASAKADGNARACDSGTLDQRKVKGKIVYCVGLGQDSTIRELGGSGLIMADDQYPDVAFSYVVAAAAIKPTDGTKIDGYVNSTKRATAIIYRTRTVNMSAPFVASFSSRGPQFITPNILKPDIAAPGLSILAAYSQLASITGSEDDNRFVKYNVISGTSMACPHVAAAAAYVKSFHSRWSPAAIKSALMTTATPMKIKQQDAELGSGSGQINPVKALHPGLIYDISMSSYISFLCKQGYNSTTIHLLTGGKKLYNCSTLRPARGTDGLNYPSMHLQLPHPNSTISAAFYRTVTNVGYKNSVYTAKVKSPEGLEVTVVPTTLSFNRLRQKRSFKVLVKGKFVEEDAWILSALLEWSDSKHSVRSPIVVYRQLSAII